MHHAYPVAEQNSLSSLGPPAGVMPRTFVQARIGWCTHSCGDLQYAIESHHRPEPAIESEHKFVEIALQVLWTDPMMCSQEPRIEIPEDDVNH